MAVIGFQRYNFFRGKVGCEWLWLSLAFTRDTVRGRQRERERERERERVVGLWDGGVLSTLCLHMSKCKKMRIKCSRILCFKSLLYNCRMFPHVPDF